MIKLPQNYITCFPALFSTEINKLLILRRKYGKQPIIQSFKPAC